MAIATEELKNQIIEKTRNIMSQNVQSVQGVQNISNTNEIDKMFKFLQISSVPENIKNKLKEVKKILIKDTDITATVPAATLVAAPSVPGTPVVAPAATLVAAPVVAKKKINNLTSP
uniref:Uncharacterized protein n=1 Tax=viral metagenome TaxID=1070528 RepID=A0A6C0EV60_9ZZZZ